MAQEWRPLRGRLRPLAPSLIEAAATGGAYAGLQAHDLVGDVSLRSFLAILVLAAVGSQFWGLTIERWGGRRWWLHGSSATNVAGTTAVMYATVWGAPLVLVGYLVVLAERARTHGWEAYLVGLPYAIVGVALGQLAVETGIFPLYEVEDGVVRHYGKSKAIAEGRPRKPVREYLLKQGRFAHFTEEDLAYFQAKVDEMWEKWELPGIIPFRRLDAAKAALEAT